MISKDDITGIVLAGGKSTRMGTDKGFVLWKSKPFVQHSIEALTSVVSEIIIVSDSPEYDTLGYKRVPDSIPEAGPLSGLYSGLKESETNLNLVLSCDVPLITSSILEKLVVAYHKGTTAVVCLADGRIMPLVALYTSDGYQVCKSLLNAGERRMMQLLAQLPSVTYVELDDEESKNVRNINSLKDLIEISDVR